MSFIVFHVSSALRLDVPPAVSATIRQAGCLRTAQAGTPVFRPALRAGSFSGTEVLHRYGLVLSLFAALAFAEAQQPAAPAAPSDPKVLKQQEAILKHKFTRDPGEILQSLERSSGLDPSTLNAHDRFTLQFRTGEWGKMREELAQMPPELARKIYDKMLADLTERPEAERPARGCARPRGRRAGRLHGGQPAQARAAPRARRAGQ